MSTYVGLDVHKKYCHATAMDEKGEILVQERFPNKEEEHDAFLDKLGGEIRVAMEATYAWEFVYELLEKKVEEVKLAHPKKVRVIGEAKIKTDCRDSEALAHLLRMDWLPEAWVPPKEVRVLQEKLRRRAYMVWKRTGFKNKIKADLAKQGIRRKFSYSEDGKEWLRSLEIEAVDDYLAIIESLNNPIDRIEEEIRREAKKDRDTEIVMSVPGIGFVWGLTFTTEIGDVNRFSGPEKLCSYAGMVPSSHQSGSTERHGSITKEGNKYLRWAAVECTWSHLKHAENTKLTRFYGKLVRKKGKQVAAVATGRKLLVILYWMLKRREKFRP